MFPYRPSDIEPKWQDYWLRNRTFRTGTDKDRPKYYVLDMFPYPSGSGLHVGHPEGYTATDILARYKRMLGYNVLHPIGWDAFGLPAEQYAVRTGTHPAETTRKNIERFRRQLQMLGFSYDWEREVDTTDPDYYRWTQWIFLKLYEKGLAYQDEVPVNWCPELGTVLANEEVIDGKSEVGGFPVVRKPMRQWMLRITEYAERLLQGLDGLDWPESTKMMQRNWIGKSIGAEVEFPLPGLDNKLRVFTTRPDTLFGATYMVIAPEHPMVDLLLTPEQEADARAYIEQAARKSDLERQELTRSKTGVFTGSYAENPVNGERIPVWIADYVLGHYGTGAIMAVPGEDERDWEFAEQFGLPILRTVRPPEGFEGGAYTGDGPSINSGFLDGLRIAEAKERMLDWLEEHGHGRRSVQYKLRDWLFSRQRYWGEPFPVIHVEGEPRPLPDDALPVILPEVDDYQPTKTGEPPLAKAGEWLRTTDPRTGEQALRETNTMPQWAGSCWYYLRYMSPQFAEGPVDPEEEAYWGPVDLYVGGAEHSVLHLLYARFWHMVLYDCGVVSSPEPFQRLVHQGMILGELEYTAWQVGGGFVKPGGEGFDRPPHPDAVRVKLSEDQVEKREDQFYVTGTDVPVDARAHKMSKSRGNVINPDEIVERYGADSLRLYEMFMGPLEQVKPWSNKGVEGVHRFLSRVWRLVMDEKTGHVRQNVTTATPDRPQMKALHEAIRKVTEDIEGLRMNTAISALMIFVNEANKWKTLPYKVIEPFLILLSPFAPHVAEELWQRLGHNQSISAQAWPELETEWLREATKTLAVQVNGKVRGQIEIPTERLDDQDHVLAEAKADENVARYLAEGILVKEIYVPGRILNLVVRQGG